MQYRNLGNFSFRDVYSQRYNMDNWKFEEDIAGNLLFKRYDHENGTFITKKTFTKASTGDSPGVNLTTWQISESKGSLVFRKYDDNSGEYVTQYLVSA